MKETQNNTEFFTKALGKKIISVGSIRYWPVKVCYASKDGLSFFDENGRDYLVNTGFEQNKWGSRWEFFQDEELTQ